MKFPQDRRYAPTHEWARPEGDLIRVGISDYAQDQLGDIVFLELPEVGRVVEAAKPFGVVESVKAVDDLCAPVSGEVVEVNRELENRPELVNEDPYERGWLILIRPAKGAVLETLMDAAAYERYCAEVKAP
ncbi:MAG: glycine cleavage system protein GcvH [Candidatus Zipacnadales bacterium]